MEYFVLKQDSHCTPPTILEWFGKLDKRAMDTKSRHEFSKYMVFDVQDHMQMQFTDIVLFPYLMVSQEASDTILMYDSSVKFLDIVVLSKQRKASEAYFVPFLPEVDCLLEGSELSPDKSVVHHAIVDKNKLMGKPIVRVDNVNCLCVLISIELAESMLCRKLTGVGLQGVECV